MTPRPQDPTKLSETRRWIDRAVEIDRELRPEWWAKVDAIARIIDPGAYPEGHDGEGNAIDWSQDVRVRALRSNAESRAVEILRYLGMGVDADWATILTRIGEERRAEEGLADA